ncbi:MAG: hypothetical protein QXU91_06885 [Thermofilum sp.]
MPIGVEFVVGETVGRCAYSAMRAHYILVFRPRFTSRFRDQGLELGDLS